MLNKKVMIVSLGCDKNLVDTEKMLGILADEGCTCLLYTSPSPRD